MQLIGICPSATSRETLHKSATRVLFEKNCKHEANGADSADTGIQTSFEKHGRKSKRELFLDHMEQVVPWSELLALVEPHSPKAGNGRQPVGLAIMLRTYFLQQWFSLSDPGKEEAFYESPVLRRFARVDLGVAAAPDETTILRFRHLLEQHDLGGEMPDTVNHYLESKGIRISTIVDATIIHAPSSTKNSTGERDPEMHQTKKGKQWYFGAKVHIGVTAGRRSCIRCVLRRPAWRTNICCPTYCTAKSAKYGAMAPIRARAKPSAQPRPRHRI
jgi:IS5 family transposase